MRITNVLLSAALILVSCNGSVAAGEAPPSASGGPKPELKDYATTELNTALMRATFEIVGPTHPLVCGLPGISSGTGFVLCEPWVGARSASRIFSGPGGATKRLVLVTAAHVIDGIDGDMAYLRGRVKEGNSWKEIDIPLPIRKKGQSLYVKHETADVAVLDLLAQVEDRYLPVLTSSIVGVPTDVLANDDVLERFQLHPGDDLSCLGFPLLTETAGAFPVLRGGKVASYPILPTETQKEFLFDFEVFPGNSGGPVYLSSRSRVISGGLSVGAYDAIVGLLTQQKISQGQALKMGVVVPASFILQTISKLPMNP